MYSPLIHALQSHRQDWKTILGFTLLTSSGHFFIQYVIHASLLGAGAQLVDLSQVRAVSVLIRCMAACVSDSCLPAVVLLIALQWIWRKWTLRGAITPAEIAAANEVSGSENLA